MKDLKKNTSFLESSILAKDFCSAFLVCAMYRNATLQFIQPIVRQSVLNNFIYDFCRKNLYQKILLKNVFNSIQLKGNIFVLYFSEFNFLSLAVLKKLFENSDSKLLLAYYKSFFFNLHRLQLLNSFGTLINIYFSLVASIFLNMCHLLQVVRPILNIVCFYLYRLDVFLVKEKLRY